MKNETLLQKIRESEVQGPFRIDIKESPRLYYNKLGFLTPLLKRWGQKEKSLKSSQDLANYLERCFMEIDELEIGYHRELVSERKGLGGGKVLKLQEISHFTNKSAKNNSPKYHIWLRVKPSF